MSYKKNTQVEVLPVVDLCKKTAKGHFFFGGRCNTGGAFCKVHLCVFTPWTDDLYYLYDLYDLFPLNGLDQSGQTAC